MNLARYISVDKEKIWERSTSPLFGSIVFNKEAARAYMFNGVEWVRMIQ